MVTTLFGISLTSCTLLRGIRLIEDLIVKGTPQLVVLANVHTLNHAFENIKYRHALQKAALVLRDGVGVAWALKKGKIPPLHNFVGTDFIPAYCRNAAAKGRRIYLLGARPGVSRNAARKLSISAPGIVIAGCHHGYFPEEDTFEVIHQINASKPDILLVAMGNPKQELWISHNLHNLDVPVSMGVGAFFDYMSGAVRRAPQWMLDSGMEWIFRLLIEPGRLWKRYVIGNPKFIMRVIFSLSPVSRKLDLGHRKWWKSQLGR